MSDVPAPPPPPTGVGEAAQTSQSAGPAGSTEALLVALDEVREVRQASGELEAVRMRMCEEVSVVEREERALREYERELELLREEKMSHVETLRLIHQDIDCMERVIKSSRGELQRARDSLTGMYEGEYRPLREDIQARRAQLGITAGVGAAANSVSTQGERKRAGAAPPPPPPPQLAGGLGLGAFRQQPPPMKSCLSCHQQIHRNAPICPLCKAKSRSRHPKKPKHKNNK